MFWKCANPECEVSFDYRQGQLFRFSVGPSNRKWRVGAHAVRHFWLCRLCAEKLSLSYREGQGVLIGHRFHGREDWKASRLIEAA